MPEMRTSTLKTETFLSNKKMICLQLFFNDNKHIVLFQKVDTKRTVSIVSFVMHTTLDVNRSQDKI